MRAGAVYLAAVGVSAIGLLGCREVSAASPGDVPSGVHSAGARALADAVRNG